jgi:hypothetical protein
MDLKFFGRWYDHAHPLTTTEYIMKNFAAEGPPKQQLIVLLTDSNHHFKKKLIASGREHRIEYISLYFYGTFLLTFLLGRFI